MKSSILYLDIALISVTLVLSSCASLEPEKHNNRTITIIFEEVPAADIAEETRTGYHDNTIWWTTDDVVRFSQYALVDGAMKLSSSTIKGTKDKELFSGTVSKFNEPDNGTDSYYYSVYPNASYNSYKVSSGVVNINLITPKMQSPRENSFDPLADLLISNYVKNLERTAEGKYSVKFAYYRQVALGKMKVTNLKTNSEIASIVISAVRNSEPVVLAGEKRYSLSELRPILNITNENQITLDYSSLNVKGCGEEGMTAHFCCYPFELGAEDSFKIVVTTKDNKTYSREITLNSNQKLVFEKGRATRFTVDMTSATVTTES